MMPRMRFLSAAALLSLAACGSSGEHDIQDVRPIFSPVGGDIRDPGPTVHSTPPVDAERPIAGGASSLNGSASGGSSPSGLTSTNGAPPTSLSSGAAPDPDGLRKIQTWETADVVVHLRTGKGNFELVQFLQSDSWYFRKRVDNKDGTMTWTFARPKRNDRSIEDLLFRRKNVVKD